MVSQVKENTKLILKFAKNHKWKFLYLFVCIMSANFIGAIFPYLFGRMVDEVFYAKNMSSFLNIVIIYGIAYVVNQTIYFGLNMLWAKLMTEFLFDIRKAMFSRVLRYKGKFLLSIHTGDIISRMNGDVRTFMDLIHWSVFYGIGSSINIIMSIALIAILNWKLAILVTVFTPIVVYTSQHFAKKSSFLFKQIRESEGFLSSWLFEILKGIQDIKLLCAAQNILSNYVGKTIRIIRLQVKISKVEVYSERVNSGILLFSRLIMYTISAIFIINGELTLGAFVACVDYFGRCINVFSNLNGTFTDIATGMVAINRVKEVLEREIEDFAEDKLISEIKEGNISFENVHFSYNDSVKVLDGISLKIKSGEKISFVGRSGAGKSTLANLIYMLFEPDYGNVKIDEVKIQEYNLYELRKQIGIVHQNIILFDGSIRYNLIFSNETQKDNLIWQALEMSNLSDFVMGLKDGLNTKLGSEGFSLSGGQKQRLAIARIFIKNPKILILDEAISSLDAESENIVKDSWDFLCKDRTIIIIAHRLSTIINSDKVAVIDNGKIVGFDKHEKLIQICEPYITMFKKQYSHENEVTA